LEAFRFGVRAALPALDLIILRALDTAGSERFAAVPMAGEIPPTSACTAGVSRVAATGAIGVGNASVEDDADNQKFSSADFTLFCASK
jgi:hypothetical protein